MRRKSTRILLTVLLLGLGTSGCATAYKHVMISVVDATTGAPVPGAIVTSSYFELYPFSPRSRRISAGVTNMDGIVILKANYHDKDNWGLSYEVEIKTANYHLNSSVGISPETQMELFARRTDYIPTTPDLVVKVRSKSDISLDMVQLDLMRQRDEAKAETLFLQSPDFWPDHKAEPYPYASDEVGMLLIEKRRNAASTIPLGTANDVESIRMVVSGRMLQSNPKIHEIRWLSPSLVMVAASWYGSPTAAAGYTYVLRKTHEGWVVLAYYMEFVS